MLEAKVMLEGVGAIRGRGKRKVVLKGISQWL